MQPLTSLSSTRLAGRLPFFLALLFVALLGTIWALSFVCCCSVAIFLPRGRIQLLGCDRGYAFVAVSNIAVERAGWMPLVFSAASHEEADAVKPSGNEWSRWKLRAQWDKGELWGMSGAWYVAGSAPMWMVVPMIALLLVPISFRVSRKSNRRRLGLCESCGYDLRATPLRCPECGKAARQEDC